VQKKRLLAFLDICRQPRNIARLLGGSPGGAGHRIFPPKFAKLDERFGYRIDQGVWLKGRRYGLVIQKNGKPHGAALAKTVVDLDKDSGEPEDIVSRLRRDAKERGYL
jgi:hypothetical protein